MTSVEVKETCPDPGEILVPFFLVALRSSDYHNICWLGLSFSIVKCTLERKLKFHIKFFLIIFSISASKQIVSWKTECFNRIIPGWNFSFHPNAHGRKLKDYKYSAPIVEMEIKTARCGILKVYVQGEMDGKEGKAFFLTVHDLGTNQKSVMKFTDHPTMYNISTR